MINGLKSGVKRPGVQYTQSTPSYIPFPSIIAVLVSLRMEKWERKIWMDCFSEQLPVMQQLYPQGHMLGLPNPKIFFRRYTSHR
jgi:hypothetical protein